MKNIKTLLTEIYKNINNWVSLILLLVVWTYLFQHPLSILIGNLLQPSKYLTFIILAFFLCLILVKTILFILKSKLKIKMLRRKFPFYTSILMLFLFMINSEFVYVNILSIFFFIIGFYCIVLQFLKINVSSNSIQSLLILLCLLPITAHLNGLLGFPLRYNIAIIVEQILALMPINSISHETVLIIENKVANIDVACSGMNSLWGASLVFLIFSWIDDIKISLKWIFTGVVFLFTIILGNIIRITCLVLLYTVFNATEFADTIHFPLGILIFVIPSMLLFVLFRYTKTFEDKSTSKSKNDYKEGALNITILVSIIFICILINDPPSINSKTTIFRSIKDSDSIELEPIDFSKGEKTLYSTYPIESYSKYRFKCKNISGSFLLVETMNWKTHHNPKDCLQGNGFKIDSIQSKVIDNNNLISLALLNDAKYSSCYWFQSNTTITNDFSKRIWKHFFSREKHWVLVSILFDKSIDLHNKENLHFIQWLQGNVSQILSKEQL